MIPGDTFKSLDAEGLALLKRTGMSANMLAKSIEADIAVSYERYNLYQELERSLEHWFVGAAVDLYANVATTYSPMHNATIWVSADSEKIGNELNGMLDRIGIEEKIHDWAYTVAGYGDLFLEPKGVPGLGIIAVEDGEHPMAISRVDYEGTLVGFYRTPSGQTIGTAPGPVGTAPANEMKLLPPWSFVHMRILGAKKKRPRGGNQGYATTRQVHLITGSDKRQVSTRYGTSIVTNGLPAYKRLRLAEDSLLLARLTRGIIRYIWKMKVDMSNSEAASALMDQYATLITRARAIDTGNSPAFDSKQNPMTVIEDIFVPVWGDVGDLTQEKIGGEADIRWIVDIDMLRNQLSFAMATPAALGGAFVKEATGALGSEAMSKLDIRFARSSRRLQRTLIAGIERLCQIHLAYMGMDPDPNLFEVHMAETSTAEEESLRKSMESGAKTFKVMIETLKKVAGKKLDSEKFWEYYNEKIMRLDDLRLEDFYKDPAVLQAEAQAAQAAKREQEQGAPPRPGEEKPGGEERSPVRLRPESIEAYSEEDLEEFRERMKEWREKMHLRERRAPGIDAYSWLPILLSVDSSDEDAPQLLESNQEVLKGDGIKVLPLMEEYKKSDWLIKRDAQAWYELAGTATVEISESEEESEVEDTSTTV
jgi:hypothetical protein